MSSSPLLRRYKANSLANSEPSCPPRSPRRGSLVNALPSVRRSLAVANGLLRSGFQARRDADAVFALAEDTSPRSQGSEGHVSMFDLETCESANV
jgi:hypothetical protein